MTAPVFPRRIFVIGFVIAAVVIAADQATKWWVVEHVMQPPRVIPLTSFFNLVMAWNRGVSFGLFSEAGFGAWVLTTLALGLCGILGVWLWRSKTLMLGIALGLVIGGALGNVVDRVRFGAVADFLDFYIGAWHWPAFNLADSAITVGAGLLILDSLFQRPDNPDR